MKKLVVFSFQAALVLGSLALSFKSTPGFASSDKPSIHGMLMVGQKSIYLSHLPMFHTPHDYQVIIEVTLRGSGNPADQYFQDRLSSNKTVYTLVPDSAFVLPEKIQKLETFQATIYRGHFERNGTPIIRNILVDIKKVIYFKKFDKNENIKANYEAILFGDQDEQFVAHKISACPDFDQVLSVELKAGGSGAPLPLNRLVTLSQQKRQNALEVGSSYLFPESQEPISSQSFKVLKQLYFETGDLACHMN
jgi:hypothetical protein